MRPARIEARVRRDTRDTLKAARESLDWARLGLADLKGDNPVRRIAGLANFVVWGRAVTNRLQNLRSSEKSAFDDWYQPHVKVMENLREAMNLHLAEVLRLDLAVGVILGGLGAWTALEAPTEFAGTLRIAAELVGVIVGTVIAGAAVIGAFLSTSFLRKLRLIGREPVRYLTPFLFTAALGVASMFAILITSSVPSSAPEWIIGVVSFVTSSLVGWTLASLIPDLNTLVQFVRLQEAASEVSDDEVMELRRASGGKKQD